KIPKTPCTRRCSTPSRSTYCCFRNSTIAPPRVSRLVPTAGPAFFSMRASSKTQLLQVASTPAGAREGLGDEPALRVGHDVLLDDEPPGIALGAEGLHDAREVHHPFAQRAEDAARPRLGHRDVALADAPDLVAA